MVGLPSLHTLKSPNPWGDFSPGLDAYLQVTLSPKGLPIAQLAKNPPAMQETPVRFLGQEDPLENGLVTHSSILGLPWWLSW